MMLSSSQKGCSAGLGESVEDSGYRYQVSIAASGDGAVFEGLVEGGFVDDVSACWVDDVGGWFHQREFVSADQAFGGGD